ncbi:beta-1,4-galactosyltransferase 7 [Leptopilina heterotoma]|uniref:beta-1,4-galactosyltransferase 7 n=1 Tax=Leptopilina heterotoma TaxID=63436 RepID=UPI001CA7D378|nr:beta-1,4-galactosyltransferase 7 [Leptopilina heterotoma]
MERFWKNLRFKYVLICIVITFIITCLISISPISNDETKYNIGPLARDRSRSLKSSNILRNRKKSKHQLAILVPFRDRFDELLKFAPHMKKFLDKQNLDYHIFILNQVDKYRFNRASLINVGFLEVKNNYDYIAMHDVDLLPMNDELLYSFPETGPFHVSSPKLHPRYHYDTFVGGILLVKREHFIKVDGMSNKYWGWGLEDDEFYVRLKEAELNVTLPQNISTTSRNTFMHLHDINRRKRDMTKCYNQREVTRKRDRQTGLHDVSYKLEEVIKLTIADSPVTVLNIALICDKSITPWCECNKMEDPNYIKIKDKKKENKTVT